MEELLKGCRYYKGERECPQDIVKINRELFWEYEKIWVERESQDPNIQQEHLREYRKYNLEDFATDDGVAIGIKALLFNRYMHWTTFGGTEDFKKWYFEKYPYPNAGNTNRER